MRKIYIIQHCQSEHHINNMSGGWTDTPLTDFGVKQAERVGLKLKSELVKEEYVLYASDLMRAKQTADIIGKHLELNVIEEAGLREINTGAAIGKTKEWAKANRNPMGERGFHIDYQEFQDGETWREFYLRVCDCMERIIHTEQKNLVIATHGGTLGYIIAWWMGFNIDMLEKAHFKASVGSISLLQTNSYQQHELHIFNDTSHLFELKS
ncbi:histidine phosphatase family protein [Paenibacillus sp. NPDC056722]|uniref:histidine phosphatase family protein n=1 Tax=Paenibacillus sp. NPDC056722 TaxID=3345924 RepID=UPI00368A42AE